MNPSFDHQLLSRHAYGLVEPSMVENLPEGIAAVPLVPPELSASEHLMPRLLVLGALSDGQQADLLGALSDAEHHGEQPVVSMVLQSALSVREFVSHWNRLQVAMPGPNRKVWLRVHDPRVLHQLIRILTPRQQTKLFVKVESCTYWLGDRWVTAKGEPIAGHDPAGSLFYSSWDWPRIEQIGIVNRALQAAGVRRASEIGDKAELAEQLISRARVRHGLSEQSDLVEFAMHGLMTAESFDLHPSILEAIRACSADDEARLADRLALIDEKVWAELGPNAMVEHERA